MIGKTSIINRYFDDVFFSDLTRSLAIDYKSKKLEEDINRYNILRILDTGGQERYDALTRSFSIYNKYSFDKLYYYLYNIIEIEGMKSFPLIKCMILGLKN